MQRNHYQYKVFNIYEMVDMIENLDSKQIQGNSFPGAEFHASNSFH